MDKAVATLNIEHYKKLLASETDATKREAIVRLLAEEEAKLAKIPEERKLDLVRAFCPIRANASGVSRDPLLRFCMHPTARNPAAWEDERVVLVAVVDGELKIALVRCGGYRLPHDFLCAHVAPAI